MSNPVEDVPHRCLKIPEVVDLVFSFAGGDLRNRGGSPSLARLARTCKGFHDLAIKHLWRHLQGLHPIRNLFQAESFIFGEGPDGAPLWYLTSKFFGDREGFMRLRKYGPHVRSILDPEMLRVNFHYYTLQQLYQHPDCPKPIFPNIKDVELLCIPALPLECIFYAPLVMSPSVRSITITTNDGDAHIPNDLRLDRIMSNARWDAVAGRIADAAPHLEQFNISALCGCFIGRVPALSSAFSKFSQSLTNLSVEALTPEKTTFNLLGQLLSLQALEISLFAVHIRDLQSAEPMELPSLQSLAIRSRSMPACVQFLVVYDMEKLERLDIALEFDVDQDVGPLIATLARRCPSRSIHLQNISIHKDYYRLAVGDLSTWDPIARAPRFIVSTATLRTLGYFSNLLGVNISPCNQLEIDDGGLIDLFSACPMLRYFSLAGELMEWTVPKLTLEGVHNALKMAPLLTYLVISVDGTKIPPNDEPSSPHQGLTHWDVQTSPLTSGNEFASWIGEHYPSLATVAFFSTYQSALSSAYLSHRDNDDERDVVDGYEGTAVMYARWLDVKAHLAIKHNKLQNLREGSESVDADN
ncbi:hypothetical protein BKA70DRAFT_1508570 [Coprinopsis sp. MPI-PUGE-AT-0042]|nr:hypothetical protein BKA70DRAFT_1508570 [Coprinopsis sp. MPI-PUGE-AT-0042]